MQPFCVVEPFAEAGEEAPRADTEHGKADADHDPERPEHHADRRLLVIGNGVEPGEGRIGIVLEDQ